jgi:hypothetical protein
MFRSQPTTGCMGAAAARAKWRSRTARSLLRARPRARSLSARDDKQERARLLASAGIGLRAQLGCDDRLLPGADLIDGVLHRGPPQPLRHTEFLRGVLTHQLVPDLTLRQVRGLGPREPGPHSGPHAIQFRPIIASVDALPALTSPSTANRRATIMSATYPSPPTARHHFSFGGHSLTA